MKHPLTPLLAALSVCSVNAIVSQLFKIGDQPVQLSFGARDYVETPAGGPEWGLRLALTFLFPKS